jgi:hypothetical protein
MQFLFLSNIKLVKKIMKTKFKKKNIYYHIAHTHTHNCLSISLITDQHMWIKLFRSQIRKHKEKRKEMGMSILCYLLVQQKSQSILTSLMIPL